MPLASVIAPIQDNLLGLAKVVKLSITLKILDSYFNQGVLRVVMATVRPEQIDLFASTRDEFSRLGFQNFTSNSEPQEIFRRPMLAA